MAESQEIERARNLTNLYSDIISTSTANTLEETAKDEIRADLSDPDIDFTSPEGRSALFWLLCLFFKVHIGDIGADGYSIGDIETKDLNSEDKFWLSQLEKSTDRLTGTAIFRHSTSSREGREYGGDRSSEGAQYGDS